MASQPVVGLIGVGLMGHGIARNVAAKGFDLVVLEHPGHQPLDELRAFLVQRVADDPAYVARYEERRAENERRLVEKTAQGPKQRAPVPQFMLDRVKRSETPAT